LGLLSWLFGGAKRTKSVSAGGEAKHRAQRWPKGLSPWLNPRRLWNLARNIDKHYREFEIELPGGRRRPITAPDNTLRFVQRRILDKVLNKVDLSESCHGFRKGRSILTNAKDHVGKDVVLAVDVKDFFPSITFPRVYGLFKHLGYDKNRAALLARLTTYKNVLPQGAPTSPAIANLVCRALDRRLCALSKKGGFTYTRYADDLTFSGPAKLVNYTRHIRDIVKDEGFALNLRKTRIMRRNHRQEVTGLVVNDKVALPREWRRDLRAALHHLKKKQPVEDKPETVYGKLAFLKMVHPEYYKAEVKAIRALA
jgi:retron-type reverse transcriptase